MAEDSRVEEIAPGVARLRVAFVNLYFVGLPRPDAAPTDATPWALVDGGLSPGTPRILDVAAERFGRDARPAAILLTHGHFDHTGALEALLAVWDVPIYAHPLELPYLTGKSRYPPPDPSVGRGLLSQLSPLFPRGALDLHGRVAKLPDNGSVPGMPGWRWVATPGHSPGHVSFFRASDRLLLAGDAVTTTRQESIYSVVTQQLELNGPPAYFTIDWDKARRSVETLAALEPEVLSTGHGPTMRGAAVADGLAALARDFDRRARPRRGRYVDHPAVTDEQGVVAVPPRRGGVRWGMLSGVAAGAVASTWLIRRFSRRSRAG